MKSDKSDKNELSQSIKTPYEASVGVVRNDEEKDERESTRKAKERYLAILEKIGRASIKLLTEQAHISRDTYYRWIEEDEEFKKNVEETAKTWDSVVEDKLLLRILNDDFSAIKFYLSHRHPEFMPRRIEKIGPNIGERSVEDMFDAYERGEEVPEFAGI